MNNFERYGPWVVMGVTALCLAFTLAPPADRADQMQLARFAALPLMDEGRIKPFDTLARTSLMIISGMQTFVDEKGDEQPAIRWLLDVMTSGPVFQMANEREGKQRFSLVAEKHRVFRIDNPELLDMLGLERRKGFRYSVEEFAGRVKMLEQEAGKVAAKDPKQLTAYEKGVVDLARHLELYIKLMSWPSKLFVIPPEEPGDDWQTFLESRDAGNQDAFGGVPAMIFAYASHSVKEFNQELSTYYSQDQGVQSEDVRRGKVETTFNYVEPFYICTVLYVVIFVLGVLSWLGLCFSWTGWTRPLGRTAFLLAILTLAVHSLALVTRMYLMDRWFVFVTNLYSSAVFIGWGCVGLCLVLEKLYHNGLGTVIASFCGALTMFVAHHLGSDSDTLALLQPVLDTNFWLATHVTCVTLGYTATFVAGCLGMAYIICGVLTPYLGKNVSTILGQMLYGILCFATLLSFTGTVLGGIWADQSWGRFWGWDPKENGALLIVIWNALILHARWGGMVKQRGMAVLAVGGNIVMTWSWFGTNQLGVGLHAYGFNDTLATGLVIFWATQLTAIVMGLLPLNRWASYEALTATPRPMESVPPRTETPPGKRRGKRHPKRGDTGYFPGPA